MARHNSSSSSPEARRDSVLRLMYLSVLVIYNGGVLITHESLESGNRYSKCDLLNLSVRVRTAIRSMLLLLLSFPFQRRRVACTIDRVSIKIVFLFSKPVAD